MSRIPEELADDDLMELYDRYNIGDWDDEEEKIWLKETLFPHTLDD